MTRISAGPNGLSASEAIAPLLSVVSPPRSAASTANQPISR
ncbi:hypothetical protein OKW87_14725 [Sphingomonas sp. M1-B02]|nr:hypothetical protein [Sphingomonas sp. S6-11]UZK65749.1 hypothetical protein OKW87_14725 [Sphingomonas sp. S6-11]